MVDFLSAVDLLWK